jgi:transitional endoplasmic reticulum ATPase
MTRHPAISVIGSAPQRRALAECPPGQPFREALDSAGCLLTEPLSPETGALPLRAVHVTWIDPATLPDGRPRYRPLGPARPVVPVAQEAEHRRQAPAAGEGGPQPGWSRPAELTDEHATQAAYYRQIDEVASFLRADLSVLVVCEKAVVQHLAAHMVRTAGREAQVIQAPPSGAESDAPDAEQSPFPVIGAPASLGQREMAQLRDQFRALKDGQVLVIPHLDLLAGGAEGFAPASTDVRELTELLYGSDKAVILAFTDPSMSIPEVLAARFSRRLSIEGSDRLIVQPDGDDVPIEYVLVTEAEAARFRGIDDSDLYKHVAGLNPVRIRQAMRYATHVHQGNPRPTAHDLHDTIRTFKAHLATGFQIPDTTFEQIGGYQEVKEQLMEALRIMEQVRNLPDDNADLKASLVPRGFIFHGPPGTGKTLFAKAVASQMRGTIQVVSGPEVTSKWVGEGERKVRDLFAEARRNAPSVIVFDEFDSIAARRSSGMEDGGSRAANAMVAQILTEMDGFRPDVSMIVIGTTNRLDIIDRALLRPSRFRSFHIDLPDVEARQQIIWVHARNHRIEMSDELAEAIARATEGWNGDELRSLFRDAYVAKWLRGDKTDEETLLAEVVAQMNKSKENEHVSTRRR